MFVDSWEKLRYRHQIISAALRLTVSPGYVFQTAVPSWKCTWLQEQALFVMPLLHSRINMSGLNIVEYVRVCDLFVFFGEFLYTSFAFAKNCLS